MPEDLPTPEKSLKQLEKENKKKLKKLRWILLNKNSYDSKLINFKNKYIFLFTFFTKTNIIKKQD